MIVDVCISCEVDGPLLSLYNTSWFPSAPTKPKFDDLRGLSCASRKLCAISMAVWLAHLIIWNLGTGG